MAELLPPTSEKTLGLGIFIDDALSYDPIAATDPNVEIQAQNGSDRGSDCPDAVVEESAATNGGMDLLNALERDLYQITIEQAEIEARGKRLGAVIEEDAGKMKLDFLHGARESRNVLNYMKNEGAELNDLHEETGGKTAVRVEDENENVMGYLENEGTLKLGNQEEMVGKIEVSIEDENVNRWSYMENKETVKLDNLHEEKGGTNAESVEYQIESGWCYMENEETLKLDNLHEGRGGKNAGIVEDENENRWSYTENVGVNEKNEKGMSRDAVMKFGKSNQSNNSKMINYPMRPDADDCTFYMRFGSCKFGSNCKFNHPLRRNSQGAKAKERANLREENSERAGQTECKYFLTSAGCRYGKDCKYSHGSDKSSMSHHSLEFNFSGLPIRPEEKECSYYMRTGTCKYGSNCRFNHPEPTTAVNADSHSDYGNGGYIPSHRVSSSSWSSPRKINHASSYTPVMFSPSQGAPISDSEWNSSQFVGSTYPSSEKSLPTPPGFGLNNVASERRLPTPPAFASNNVPSERRLPTPPAFALNNVPTESRLPIPPEFALNNVPTERSLPVPPAFALNNEINFPMLDEYPERMGEPVCSFFMKTGDCKFKSNCKFHHPKKHIPKVRANLSDKGLPLRPDQPICTHYHRYGICKYGPACKYDHPSGFDNLQLPFDNQSPF